MENQAAPKTKEYSDVHTDALRHMYDEASTGELATDQARAKFRVGAAAATLIMNESASNKGIAISDVESFATPKGRKIDSDQATQASIHVSKEIMLGNFKPEKASDTTRRVLCYAGAMQWASEIQKSFVSGRTGTLNEGQRNLVKEGRYNDDTRNDVAYLSEGRFAEVSPKMMEAVEDLVKKDRLDPRMEHKVAQMRGGIDQAGEKHGERLAQQMETGSHLAGRDPTRTDLNTIENIITGKASEDGNIRTAIKRHYEMERGHPWVDRELKDPLFDTMKISYARINANESLKEMDPSEMIKYAVNDMGIREEPNVKHGITADDRKRFEGNYVEMSQEGRGEVEKMIETQEKLSPQKRVMAELAAQGDLKMTERTRNYAPSVKEKMATKMKNLTNNFGVPF